MSQTYWPYAIDADEAPPLDADRLILWLARRQWRTILGGVLFGVPWMLSIALVPAAIGKAIDEGLVAHDEQALCIVVRRDHGPGPAQRGHDQRPALVRRAQLAASRRSAPPSSPSARCAGPARR